MTQTLVPSTGVSRSKKQSGEEDKKTIDMRKKLGELMDQRDGLQMHIQGLMAKLNAQERRLGILAHEVQKQTAKAEATMEILKEIISHPAVTNIAGD